MYVSQRDYRAHFAPARTASVDHLIPITHEQLSRVLSRLDGTGMAQLLRRGWVDIAGANHVRLVTSIVSDPYHLPQGPSGMRVLYSDHQMIIDEVTRRYGDEIKQRATNRLAVLHPEMSAFKVMTAWQCIAGIFIIGLVMAGIWFRPELTSLITVIAFSTFFISVSCLKLFSIFAHGKVQLPKGQILSDDQLPMYTLLVPLFQETSILKQTIGALRTLNYPRHKLDVKIIVEEDDHSTRKMVAQLVPGTGFDIITVPRGSPQTKPRALNYALFFARGDLVTIYDAEDIPQPMQLRLAAQRFAEAPDEIACLQARLAYYNTRENWLTKQFSIEYASLFDLMLPMLARFQLPLPLGGTSNHFRLSALRETGGWDAWNVTEDADLGIRLARAGYQCEVLASTTFEEANCQLGNWFGQRARWLKGYMQTWLVHMRNPVRSIRELGFSGFFVSQLLIAGMIGSALLHPIFIAIMVHHFWMLDLSSATFAEQIYNIIASAVFVLGYCATMIAGIKALYLRRLYILFPVVLTMPVYWLLISAGGWLALWQLITA
ncbi:MAG: glycosyltransferase, partial [Anderseniella sp.]